MKPAAHDAAEDLILYGRAVINDKGELIHPMDEKTFIKNLPPQYRDKRITMEHYEITGTATLSDEFTISYTHSAVVKLRKYIRIFGLKIPIGYRLGIPETFTIFGRVFNPGEEAKVHFDKLTEKWEFVN